MTEDQIVAKIMKISSDLGLRGHQTIEKIYLWMSSSTKTMSDLDSQDIHSLYYDDWKIGDQTSIKLITEIERILTEKGVLS